jgi:tetratricopeptide (TPR) repeat protein
MLLKFPRSSAILPAALFLLAPAFGQQGGAPPDPQPQAPVAQPPDTTNPPPEAPAPVVIRPSLTPQPPSAPPPAIPLEHPQPMWVTGRVVRDDGLPFSEPVMIESVCDGVSHSEGYSTVSGDFGFRLGDSGSGIIQDASVGSQNDYFGMANVPINMNAGGDSPPVYITPKQIEMANCEIRAALPGYRSDAVSIGSRRALDNPNVGALVLHRMNPTGNATVSATTLAAPKDARSAYEKGLAALKKNKPDDARKQFEMAVRAYPGFAAAWFEVGKLESGQGAFDDALRSLNTAIQADPKYAEPYLTLAAIYAVQKQWQKVADATNTLAGLNPYDYPQAYYMNAMANYNLHNLDASEKSARETERLDTQGKFPKVWRILGAILEERRAYREAADQLRQYLRLAPQAADAADAQRQLAQLEALASKTISK